MKKFFATVFALSALAVFASAADKPNIIFLLADDIGYADLGCYGGRASPSCSPNLDLDGSAARGRPDYARPGRLEAGERVQ